jgi:hypothetical protein
MKSCAWAVRLKRSPATRFRNSATFAACEAKWTCTWATRLRSSPAARASACRASVRAPEAAP